MPLARRGEAARRDVAHPLDRTDGGATVLLDDQHGQERYTLRRVRYSVDVSDVAALVVLSTFPDAEKAAQVARVLVDEQLAACVNLVPSVRSIYRWQGAVQDEAEVLALIKTTAERHAALAARLAALHPYDVPEILALPVAAVHPPYLAWLAGG
jgi:periplasmic divalent cation tolerance protein